MKYYKVKKEADQVRKSHSNTDILISQELYTTKELMKIAPLDSVFCSKEF